MDLNVDIITTALAGKDIPVPLAEGYSYRLKEVIPHSSSEETSDDFFVAFLIYRDGKLATATKDGKQTSCKVGMVIGKDRGDGLFDMAAVSDMLLDRSSRMFGRRFVKNIMSFLDGSTNGYGATPELT
jgi:hypothetical protein